VEKIKIVTDSTCDIPIDLVERYDIQVIPCYVNMNGKSYLDGVEMSREQFFQSLPTAHPLPTTSAPGTDTFLQVYRQLAQSGATGIISIHISASLSNIINVARMAAASIHDIPIVVIDSGQLSMGLGLLALLAAKTAQTGVSLEEIETTILAKRPLTNAFAELETLEYLRRGGRLSSAMQHIGNLLDLKPITKMSDGVSGLEVHRTSKKTHQRLLEIARDLGPAEMAGIIHADAYGKALQTRDELQQIWPGVEPIISYVTPAIGSHVGPGTICIVSIQKEFHKPLIESRLTKIRNRVSHLRHHLPGKGSDVAEDS